MESLILYLIRHGKTEANEKQLYYGKSDVNLSEKGKKELNEIKDEIKYPECNNLFTSGAKRANETINILYPNNQYIELNEFWEYDFGDFELKSYDILKENKDYIKWITDESGEVACPNGESKLEYKKRITDAFNSFIEMCYEQKLKSALIVCHGGTIGAILENFYDNSKSFFEYQPQCGRGYKIEIAVLDKIKFKIISVDKI